MICNIERIKDKNIDITEIIKVVLKFLSLHYSKNVSKSIRCKKIIKNIKDISNMKLTIHKSVSQKFLKPLISELCHLGSHVIENSNFDLMKALFKVRLVTKRWTQFTADPSSLPWLEALSLINFRLRQVVSATGKRMKKKASESKKKQPRFLLAALS